MKILIAFALLLLSGCMSVERLGPYELAPARNPPSMKVQPANLQAVYHASDCVGSVANSVCNESTSPDGKIAANAPGN
jgi:PBP1b-binding outer membrane lipoprotein LpoB